MTTKSATNYLFLEVALALCIAVAVLVLMFVDANRDKQIQERYVETLMVPAEQLGINDTELQELITAYSPQPYKMIEIYNQDLKLEFRVQFGGNDVVVKDNLSNHPAFVEYFYSHEEGHTNYSIENNETDVYFKWIHSESTGEDDLVIVYTSRSTVGSNWLHFFICFVILMASFAIVISSLLKRGRDRVREYSKNKRRILGMLQTPY